MATVQLATGPGLRELRVATFAHDRPTPIALLPDAMVSLMFRMGRGGETDLVVIGPLSRARRKRAAGIDFTVVAVLEPQVARAVIGVPLGELADRVATLDDVWHGSVDRLRARLVAASPIEVGRALAAEVAVRRKPGTVTDALVARARGLLDAGDSIAEAATALGVTERYLRRVFVDRVGLPPKRYARIARLQRVLDHISTPVGHRRPDWARIAAEAGYFDQSHFVNDFRDLTAVTPEVYERSRDVTV